LAGCSENSSLQNSTNISGSFDRNKGFDDKKEVLTNNYDVSIKVNPESNIIVGNEKVKFKNSEKKEVNSLYFKLYLNGLSEECRDDTFLCYPEYLDSVYKYGENFGGINILKVIVENDDVEFSVDKTVLCVKLKESLKPDSEMSLTINFEAKIPNICYRIGANDKACWMGSFLPVLYGVGSEFSENKTKFVRGLPFYDGFSNYSVSVSIPEGYSVIGSGVSNIVENDFEKTVTFNGSLVRDFAFVFGRNFKKESLSLDNIDINFYYYSDDIDYERLISKARQCVEYINEKLGSYPYTEINIVETELYSKICANYPQVIFADSEYIKSNQFENDFCYNFSQQWIYNIIGADKIGEAWLCEGLAAYLNDSMIYSESEFSEIISERINDFKAKIPSLEIKKMDTPMENFSTEENYHYIENVKAEIMFYYLSREMGKNDFDEFLKRVYSEYIFRGIDKEKLIGLSKQFFDSAGEFFDSWLEGDGLPI